jgi:hypothetical protein
VHRSGRRLPRQTGPPQRRQQHRELHEARRVARVGLIAGRHHQRPPRFAARERREEHIAHSGLSPIGAHWSVLQGHGGRRRDGAPEHRHCSFEQMPCPLTVEGDMQRQRQIEKPCRKNSNETRQQPMRVHGDDVLACDLTAQSLQQGARHAPARTAGQNRAHRGVEPRPRCATMVVIEQHDGLRHAAR